LEVLKDEVHGLEGWVEDLEQRDGNRRDWRVSAATELAQGSGDGRSGADRKRRERQNREQRWAPFALSADGLHLVDVDFD
jgi:hypothetical protein